MSRRRLVVVGAGITGLSAAFEWRRRRPDDEIVVLEAGNRIGGKLHRVELAGTWYDTGPEAVLARVPEAVRLIEDLGLADRLVAPATTQASVVLPDGRHPLPAGTVLGVPASADGLEEILSPEGIDRVRAEAELPPLRRDGDVSVGRLLRDRLGDEVGDRLVEPLLGGVYAGRPDDLSLAATMPALAAPLPASTSVLGAAIAARDAGPRRVALSVEECCQALGCSRHYFAEHIAAEIPTVRRGRKRLVSVAALEAWLLEHASTGVDPDEGRVR